MSTLKVCTVGAAARVQTTMNVYGTAMLDSKRRANSKVVQMVLGAVAEKEKGLPSGNPVICSLLFPRLNRGIVRNSMIPLVAGGGFEPPTFGL